jgi:hypothetical protein
MTDVGLWRTWAEGGDESKLSGREQMVKLRGMEGVPVRVVMRSNVAKMELKS